MGGGDLNLKKSWHPSTLRNIERVWKAEQKHEVEKQKIEQLQKELAEERAKEEIQAYAEDQGVVKRREERLDWMYQGPAAMVNREEYLLGRKVDKTLELLEQEETGVAPKSDDHDVVGSSMFSSQDLSGTETVDLANKIREDPLFSIRKKEKEQRKNLLCNPVKMKQLQQMLQKSLGKDKKRNKKSHDSDADRKHRRKHKRSSSHSSEEETKPQDHHHHRSSKKFSSREDTSERYCAKESRRNGHHSSNGDRDGHSSSTKYANGHSSRGAAPQSHSSKKNSEDRNKRRMDDGERERRLREMQEDARRMEEQRAKKVRRYREDEKREEEARRVDASDFIKPLLSKAAGKGSVENRVKQKVFSIQRSHGDMDRNFVRR